MSETEEIKNRYERRKASDVVESNQKNILYSKFISEERERLYEKILKEKFGSLSEIKLLEIGAGNGSNLLFFISIGVKKENIYANELLPDRVEALTKNVPGIKIFPGDVLKMESGEKMDVVFQSTVFSSILDSEFRKKVADKMLELVNDNGIILWYDFIYNNPNNPDVRKVDKNEIRNLFPGCSIEFKKVTLAPPIGRRVGRAYKFLNFLFPFLRSHLIAVIRKS